MNCGCDAQIKPHTYTKNHIISVSPRISTTTIQFTLSHIHTKTLQSLQKLSLCFSVSFFLCVSFCVYLLPKIPSKTNVYLLESSYRFCAFVSNCLLIRQTSLKKRSNSWPKRKMKASSSCFRLYKRWCGLKKGSSPFLLVHRVWD